MINEIEIEKKVLVLYLSSFKELLYERMFKKLSIKEGECYSLLSLPFETLLNCWCYANDKSLQIEIHNKVKENLKIDEDTALKIRENVFGIKRKQKQDKGDKGREKIKTVKLTTEKINKCLTIQSGFFLLKELIENRELGIRDVLEEKLSLSKLNKSHYKKEWSEIGKYLKEKEKIGLLFDAYKLSLKDQKQKQKLKKDYDCYIIRKIAGQVAATPRSGMTCIHCEKNPCLTEESLRNNFNFKEIFEKQDRDKVMLRKEEVILQRKSEKFVFEIKQVCFFSVFVDRFFKFEKNKFGYGTFYSKKEPELFLENKFKKCNVYKIKRFLEMENNQRREKVFKELKSLDFCHFELENEIDESLFQSILIPTKIKDFFSERFLIASHHGPSSFDSIMKLLLVYPFLLKKVLEEYEIENLKYRNNSMSLKKKDIKKYIENDTYRVKQCLLFLTLSEEMSEEMFKVYGDEYKDYLNLRYYLFQTEIWDSFDKFLYDGSLCERFCKIPNFYAFYLPDHLIKKVGRENSRTKEIDEEKLDIINKNVKKRKTLKEIEDLVFGASDLGSKLTLLFWNDVTNIGILKELKKTIKEVYKKKKKFIVSPEVNAVKILKNTFYLPVDGEMPGGCSGGAGKSKNGVAFLNCFSYSGTLECFGVNFSNEIVKEEYLNGIKRIYGKEKFENFLKKYSPEKLSTFIEYTKKEEQKEESGIMESISSQKKKVKGALDAIESKNLFQMDYKICYGAIFGKKEHERESVFKGEYCSKCEIPFEVVGGVLCTCKEILKTKFCSNCGKNFKDFFIIPIK